MCAHPKNRRESRTIGYAGPVAKQENPAAHGGICNHETCLVCGAARATNINGSHVERGPWRAPPEWDPVARGTRRDIGRVPMYREVRFDVSHRAGEWCLRAVDGPTIHTVGRYGTRVAAVAAAAAAAALA